MACETVSIYFNTTLVFIKLTAAAPIATIGTDFNTTLVFIKRYFIFFSLGAFPYFNTTLVFIKLTQGVGTTIKGLGFQYNSCFY